MKIKRNNYKRFDVGLVESDILTVLETPPRSMPLHATCISTEGSFQNSSKDIERRCLCSCYIFSQMNVTAKLVETLIAHTSDINSVAFSVRFLASCSGDKSIRLYDSELLQETNASPLIGHTYYVNGVVFSPFGTILASCSTDGRAILWDPNSGAKLSVFMHPSKAGIRVVTFSLNSQMLSSGAEDGSICLWDVTSKLLLRTFLGHESSVHALAFTPDSLYLVSGSTQGDLRVWDARYGHAKQLRLELDGHDLGVSGADISPIMDVAESFDHIYQLASCGADNFARLWRLSSTARDLQIGLTILHTLKGHSGPVMCVRFSPNGRLVASCSIDHTLRIWDSENGASLHVIDAHSRYVTSCCFSPDGRFLASGSNDRSLRIWKLLVEDEGCKDAQVQDEVSLDMVNASLTHWTPSTLWTVDHVARFVTRIGLSQYVTSFYQQAVDGVVLNQLTEDQMERDLGMSVLGHRKQLTAALNELKNNKLSIAPSTGGNDMADEFHCPITHELMADPVIAADGYTYERSAIEAWLSGGKIISPMTNAPLGHINLLPNRSLKMLINRHLEKQSN